MARVAALLLLLCPLAAPALTPAAQARLLPPRGYNPCNGLQCNMGLLGEAALLALAESIVSTGLAAANYTWLNLDDGIISHRDPVTQQLVADTAAFPSGTLQPLAAAVGALGLSLGAYTDRGDRTCEGRPGAQGFEAQDAATWASWGVRWLKEDSCASSGDFSVAAQQYGAMAAGLRATGQDVFFSLCGWFSGFAAFSALSPTIGDAWRVGTDVPNFERFLQNIESADAAAAFSGPSKGWPDIDMIGGHWPAQQETLHLAFIALIGAPLLLSWNVSDPGASTLPLSAYLNPELLALHSDDPAPAVAARGRYYARLAGGAVTGSASARYTGLPLDTATPCADARAAFAFTPAAPGSATGALASLAAPGLCLGAWDTWAGACIDALAVQLVPCGSTANGCDARAQQWTHNASSLLLASALDWGGATPRPGPYLSHVGAVPGALYLQSASAAPPPPPAAAPPLAQAWQWLPLGGASGGNASSVALQGADGQCLGSPLGGDSASGANVWARWLANGDVALLLFNAGLSPADATCDAACLGAALGAAGHAQWRARDVWRRADAGVVTVAEGVRAAGLAAQGGTLLLRLTPLQ